MSGTFGDIRKKEDLLNSLFSLRAAAIYDIFAQICLHEFFKQANKGLTDLSSLSTILPEGKITLKEFTEQIEKHGNQALVETKRNANRFLTRNLLKESFRITESYCTLTRQKNTLKNEEWHQFARIIVNSLSHNFRLEFRPYDKKQLPVTYKNIEINESMDDKPISFKLQILLDLTEEIMEFSKGRLT